MKVDCAILSLHMPLAEGGRGNTSSLEEKLSTMQTTRQALTSQYVTCTPCDVIHVDALAGAYKVAQNLTYMYILSFK